VSVLGREPRTARLLGLWTAAWLGGLLLAGLLWVGDLSVQWPVLVVPLIWALVALRPRGPRSPGDGF
jgi:fatty acid desaturase